MIAEKILAIEAERDTQVTGNKKLNNYVQGIKEQKMRELYYNNFAMEKVNVDEQQLKEIVKAANRSYELAYFDVPASANYDSIGSVLLSENKSFDQVVKSIYPESETPVQDVSWRDVYNSDLFEALYTKRAEPGQIIGPVSRQDNRVFFFKVNSWKNVVPTSETDQKLLYENVKNALKNTMAANKYEEVIRELMDGKELVFNMEGLVPLVNMLGPILLREDQGPNFLNDPSERIRQEIKLDTLLNSKNHFGKRVVLTIDNKNWTIDKILAEISVHPLVFRKKKIQKREFGEQLKYALGDLLRDHYITQEAYKLGYDERDEIKRAEKLWTDYFRAVLMREKTLAQIQDSTTNSLEYMDHETRLLRNKYKPDVKIDEDIFNKIEIADIQFFATQKNVPYPLVTPGFPLLTLDDK